MMQRLISAGFIVKRMVVILRPVIQNAQDIQIPFGHGGKIDLVEGQPVFYFILVPFKDSHCIPHKIIDYPAVRKSLIRFHQMIRNLKVRQRNQRFDSVLNTF